MVKTKFMTRIFSAIEKDETAVLEQLDKDLDIAKEDGSCEGDQYVITASDDKVILHDKINNEDTEIIEDENGEVTFSKVDLEGKDAPDEELPLVEEKEFNDMSDEELDSVVTCESIKFSKVKKFSLESLKSFAKGGWRDGKLYIKMGDNDVALDLKNKVAIVIDENLSCPIDPKKSFIDNLTTVEKFMKENNLKVFSLNEIGAAVIKNTDGTYEVVSIEDEKDKSRLDSYKKEGCKVIKKCKNTIEADKYIDEKGLKRAYSDANPTPEQEGVINFLKGFVEEHPGEAKYLVELGAKWGPDNLLEGLNHDAEGDKNFSGSFDSSTMQYITDNDQYRVGDTITRSGECYELSKLISNDNDEYIWQVKACSKTFTSGNDANLLKLAKQLATMDTEFLEQIDESQWDKFDKNHGNIQKGFQNIANGLLGWGHVTDQQLKSFVLDRAEEIHIASGTEISFLEEYMEDLLKFVKSKGQRLFSKGEFGGGYDPDDYPYYVVQIVGNGPAKNVVRSLDWVRSHKDDRGVSFTPCTTKEEAEKKVSEMNKTFSNKFSKFSLAVTKMFSPGSNDDEELYEAHILSGREDGEYYAEGEVFGPATKEKLKEMLNKAAENVKSVNANPPSPGHREYAPDHIGYFNTKKEAEDAAYAKADELMEEERGYSKKFSKFSPAVAKMFSKK